MKLKLALAATVSAAILSLADPAGAATCIGNCGTLGANGDVTLSPTGNASYDYVVSNGGRTGAGVIAGYEGGAEGSEDGGTTNGSELLSDAFFGSVGSTVQFYFNYITSDGAEFADYAFAQLLKLDGSGGVASTINLFTARTKPSGPIVPGQDLPDVTAKLEPGSVTIRNGSGPISSINDEGEEGEGSGLPGGPVWSPLEGSSGACYEAGCGLTDWVKSSYVIEEAGTYQLRFGVTNYRDEAFDSGLAFDGLMLNNSTIGDGSSADNPLLPTEIGPNGEFLFTFTATPNEMVYIDPLVAVGYEYRVLSGETIIAARFADLGDADGYDIYTLDDILIAAGVMGGDLFIFEDAVTGFKLLGIDPALSLDPEDGGAFVTGLMFNISGSTTVDISQRAISALVPDVPEPASWATMLLGFGLLGAAMRRRAPGAIAT